MFDHESAHSRGKFVNGKFVEDRQTPIPISRAVAVNNRQGDSAGSQDFGDSKRVGLRGPGRVSLAERDFTRAQQMRAAQPPRIYSGREVSTKPVVIPIDAPRPPIGPLTPESLRATLARGTTQMRELQGQMGSRKLRGVVGEITQGLSLVSNTGSSRIR